MSSDILSLDHFINNTLHAGFKITHYTRSDDGFVTFHVRRFETFPGMPPQTWDCSVRIDSALETFLQNIDATIENQNRRYRRLDREKGFILVDVVGFSRLSLDDQLGLMGRLQSIIRNHTTDTVTRYDQIVEAFLPTGDGCYIVFCVEGVPHMIEYTEVLLGEINGYNGTFPQNIFLRIAINAGIVDYFYDLSGRWNYIGNGINETERIISQIPKNEYNVVFVGETAVRRMMGHDIDRQFGPLTVFKDKHSFEHLYRRLL